MAHPLDDAFWPNNRPQTNRNSVKTLTKTGPYQTSTAEFRLNYVQLIGIGQQISFGQVLIAQSAYQHSLNRLNEVCKGA